MGGTVNHLRHGGRRRNKGTPRHLCAEAATVGGTVFLWRSGRRVVERCLRRALALAAARGPRFVCYSFERPQFVAEHVTPRVIANAPQSPEFEAIKRARWEAVVRLPLEDTWITLDEYRARRAARGEP